MVGINASLFIHLFSTGTAAQLVLEIGIFLTQVKEVAQFLLPVMTLSLLLIRSFIFIFAFILIYR